MKTILRNSDGEIAWIHVYDNVYLTPKAHKVLMETNVTVSMVENTYGNPSYAISAIANDLINPLMVKCVILTNAGLIGSEDKKFL